MGFNRFRSVKIKFLHNYSQATCAAQANSKWQASSPGEAWAGLWAEALGKQKRAGHWQESN